MWYPATITTPAASEPVSEAEAKAQCSVESADTYFDDLLNRLIQSARAHVERYCGVRFATQTVSIKCDSFADMDRLPEAPISSVTSISYVDTDGDAATVSSDVYELRSDGLEAAIVLKFGQAWPSIQPGSRITMIAVVGTATVPKDVKHAMLMLIAHWFRTRESVVVGESAVTAPNSVDDLLSNHRRGV